MRKRESRFSERVSICLPPRVVPLIDRGAERKCMTPSEYIRRAVLDQLADDGISLAEAS